MRITLTKHNMAATPKSPPGVDTRTGNDLLSEAEANPVRFE